MPLLSTNILETHAHKNNSLLHLIQMSEQRQIGERNTNQTQTHL